MSDTYEEQPVLWPTQESVSYQTQIQSTHFSVVWCRQKLCIHFRIVTKVWRNRIKSVKYPVHRARDRRFPPSKSYHSENDHGLHSCGFLEVNLCLCAVFEEDRR